MFVALCESEDGESVSGMSDAPFATNYTICTALFRLIETDRDYVGEIFETKKQTFLSAQALRMQGFHKPLITKAFVL